MLELNLAPAVGALIAAGQVGQPGITGQLFAISVHSDHREILTAKTALRCDFDPTPDSF